MLRKIGRTVIMIAAALAAAGMALAQSPGADFAAVAGGQLSIYTADGTATVNNPTNRGVSNLVWSPDGSKLAYILADENFQARVMVADAAGGDPAMLETGPLAAGFPLAFTPDGDLLFAAHADVIPQANQGVLTTVNRIKPEAGAVPQVIGSFPFGVGCGGGSSIPADWQYWGETGFGGNYLTLAWTDYGLLYSTTCAGSGLALLDLTTGESRQVAGETLSAQGPSVVGIGRAALAPDGRLVAAVRTRYSEPNLIRSLAVVDLATGTVTDVSTAFEPDQVAWGPDGSVFYSARQRAGDLTGSLTPDERATVATALGYVQPSDMESLPAYQAAVYRMNLATGEETPVYQAPAYAVGRMALAADGRHLYVSLVANLDGWIRGLLDGSLDLAQDLYGDQQRALVPVSLVRVPLVTREAPLTLGPDLAQFRLRPQG